MTKKPPRTKPTLSISSNTMTIEQALHSLIETKDELISTQRMVITEQRYIMTIYEERHQVACNLWQAIEERYPEVWETLEDLRMQIQIEAATELTETLKVNKEQYPEAWEAFKRAVIPES